MKKTSITQRRSFIKKLSGTAVLTAASSQFLLGHDDEFILSPKKKFIGSANDNIQIATIG